jgi:lactate dehydrogenase-like 2-hydroxyacid dehydrogenase
LYNKRNRLPAAAEQELELQYATMDEITEQVTWFVLCCRIILRNSFILGVEFFQKMKEGLCLCTVALGGNLM